MPLPHQTIPMSIDKYHTMKHRLGWKHEYFDGAAQLSCQESAIVHYELDLNSVADKSLELPSQLTLRPVTPGDVAALVELFKIVFDRAVEYIGWSDEGYEKDALRCVERCTKSKAAIAHSFLLQDQLETVAAILIACKKKGITIEPVMVHPEFQRRGLGSALLSATCGSLREAGHSRLRSCCHLGNPGSLHWHEKVGFEKQPSYFGDSHRWRHYQWQTSHFASLGETKKAADTKRLAEHWRKVAEESEKLMIREHERQYSEMP